MRRSLRSLTASVLSGLVLVEALSAAGVLTPLAPAPALAGGLPSCTTAQLKPEIADIAVNQGLNYPILNRGKLTLVRLFLRLPSTCAVPKNTAIAVSDASITFQATGAAAVTESAPVKPSGALQAAMQVNASTDPVFPIPGSALIPNTDGTAFQLQIQSATIKYSVNGASPVQGAPASVVTLPYSAKFEPKTNALRILVVPLVLTGQTTWSQQGSDAMAAAMAALSRMAPVPDGTQASLTANTGGVRYVIGAPVNISGYTALLQSGLFCGTGINFPTISSVLSSSLTAWNAAQPNQPVDRVVGAVDAASSLGSAAHCDEGRAAAPIGSAPAVVEWVRALPDGTTPSFTGSVLAMEMLHTWGGCAYDGTNGTTAARCLKGGYHSSTTADFSASRGYNLTSLQYLASPPTVMQFEPTASPWNRATTLFETPDYLLFSCVLTPGFVAPAGTTVAGCDNTSSGVGQPAGSSGTGSGVPAGAAYFLTGSTDGVGTLHACPATRTLTNPVGDARYSAPGTSVYGSFTTNVNAQHFPITVDPGSDYRVRYLAGGAAVGPADGYGVPVARTAGVGDHGSTGQAASAWVVSAAIPFASGADQIEFVLNTANHADPGQDLVLYCVNKVDPPRLQAGAVAGPSRVAYVKDVDGVRNVYTANADGTGEQPLTANADPDLTIADPVWSPDATALIYRTYETGDNVHLVNADGTGDRHIPNLHTSRPVAWTPDGLRILVSLDGSDALTIVNPDVGGPGATLSPPTAVAGAVMSPDARFLLGFDPQSAEPVISYVPALVTDAATAHEAVPMPPGVDGVETAVWSPDGTHLAFTGSTEGGPQVFVVPVTWPSGTHLPTLGAPVLYDTVGAREPSFSPDGTSLYYVADDTTPQPGLHRIALAAGTDTLVLAGILRHGTSVSIATPTRRLAELCITSNGICVENANGSGRTVVATGQPSYSGVAWSPDGSRLAYTAPQTIFGSPGLYTVRPDGNGTTKLVTMDQAVHPVWSPDGKWIAFGSGSTTYVVAADGTGPVAKLDGLWGANWAPDSAHLVGQYADGMGFARWDGTKLTQYGGLWCDGVQVAAASCGSLSYTSGVFSPDGKRLASSDANLKAGIATVSWPAGGDPLPGSAFKPLAIPDGPNGDQTITQFLPDNDHFLMSATRAKQSGATAGVLDVWTASVSKNGADAVALGNVVDEMQSYPTLSPTLSPPNAVGVVSSVPTDVSLTIYYQCPSGIDVPVAVRVTPAQIASGSGSLYAGFDPATVCGGGPGKLLVVANDGFSVSNLLDMGTFTPAAKLPSPSIDAPIAGGRLDAHGQVVLSGRATSAQGDAFALAWTVSQPGLGSFSVGSGESVDVVGSRIPAAFRQPDGAWKPGAYTASLTATDPAGRHTTTSIAFVIVAPPVVSVTGVVDGGQYALGGITSSPAVPVPSCATTDAGGGIATPAVLSVAPAGIDPLAIGVHTATCSGATDAGGRAAPAATATYAILAIPIVSVGGVTSGGTYPLGTPAPTCVVQAGSGIAPVGVAPTLTVVTSSPNGTGTVTASCSGGTTAAPNGDAVALAPSAPVMYTVTYPKGVFLAPLHGRGVIKVGQDRTLPIRLSFSTMPGVAFNPAAWTVTAVPVGCTAPYRAAGSPLPIAATGAKTGFRLVGNGVYQFNASLVALRPGSCWRLAVHLDDGRTVLMSPVLKIARPPGALTP